MFSGLSSLNFIVTYFYIIQVARLVLLWVNNHFNDFETSGEMMEKLQYFESALEREVCLEFITQVPYLMTIEFDLATKLYLRLDGQHSSIMFLELQGMNNHQSLLNIACSVKSRARTVVYTRSNRDEVLHFRLHIKVLSSSSTSFCSSDF